MEPSYNNILSNRNLHESLYTENLANESEDSCSTTSILLEEVDDKDRSLIQSLAKSNFIIERTQSNRPKLKVKLPPLPKVEDKADLSIINSNSLLNIVKTNSKRDPAISSTCEIENQDHWDDFITLESIEKLNSQIGSDKNPKLISELINKMRKLGGLEPSERPIDIPNARLGLCFLAHYDREQELKMLALESLLEILKQDDYSKESSYHLITLATNLVNLLGRTIVQTADLETQIKISEVYKVLMETIHMHAGKKHLNGITNTTKQQLIAASKELKLLNRINNNEIEFYTSCALLALDRLKDDTQELFVIVEGLYKLSFAALAIYLEEPEISYRLFKEIFFSAKDLNINPSKNPWHWYNSLLVLKALVRDVIKKESHNQNSSRIIDDDKKIISLKSETTISPEIEKKGGREFELITILTLINKKKTDWRFIWGALECLLELTLNGKTREIRMQAFKGIFFREETDEKQKAVILPGLADFAGFRKLYTNIDFKSLVHLKAPKVFDPNLFVREACARHIMKLIDKTQDPLIMQKAVKVLVRRVVLEEHLPIREMIKKYLNEKEIVYDPHKITHKITGQIKEKKSFIISKK